MSSKRILIAGFGYVGSRLGVELARHGHEVWGLKRSPSSKSPTGVRLIAADVLRPDTLSALPAVDQLVYAVSASGFREAAYREAYCDGLRNVLAALDHETLQRVVFVSSTGVYGQTSGAWVDESTPPEPAGFSGEVLAEAETVAASWGGETTSLRFGGIYGPGRTSFIERVRRGEELLDTNAPRFTNRIHVDDCVGSLVHLLALPKVLAVYNGVDDEPAALNDVITWLARELGVPLPGKVPSDAPLPAIRGNKRCRNDRLRQAGYQFHFPTYREGYRSLLKGPAANA